MFEKTFTDPIWKQITDVLDYIKTNVIIEKTVKIETINHPYFYCLFLSIMSYYYPLKNLLDIPF